MTTRREFLRRGALWVAAAAVVEPVARKLWAFPTNPLGGTSLYVANTTQHFSMMRVGDELEFVWADNVARVYLIRRDGTRSLLPSSAISRGGVVHISINQVLA